MINGLQLYTMFNIEVNLACSLLDPLRSWVRYAGTKLIQVVLRHAVSFCRDLQCLPLFFLLHRKLGLLSRVLECVYLTSFNYLEVVWHLAMRDAMP